MKNTKLLDYVGGGGFSNWWAVHTLLLPTDIPPGNEELKDIGEAVEEHMKPTHSQGTGWIDHRRNTLPSLDSNFRRIIAHLLDRQDDPKILDEEVFNPVNMPAEDTISVIEQCGDSELCKLCEHFLWAWLQCGRCGESVWKQNMTLCGTTRGRPSLCYDTDWKRSASISIYSISSGLSHQDSLFPHLKQSSSFAQWSEYKETGA